MAGNSTKKKTTASASTKKKTSGKTSKAAVEQDTSFLQSEAAILGAFAVCVFLFLSNFHICGVVGNVASQVMLGVFGSIGYVAPVLLFVGMIFYASNKGNIRAVYKMLAVEILLIVLCGFAQLLFGGGYQEGQTIKEIYEVAGENGVGGGVIGGALVLVLHTAVGTIGAYLVLLVCMIISIVCITEKSFVSVVKRGSGRAYQYAKEDYDRRKEIREEKREEKRLLREEQRVQGVNLNSTDLSRNTGAQPGAFAAGGAGTYGAATAAAAAAGQSGGGAGFGAAAGMAAGQAGDFAASGSGGRSGTGKAAGVSGKDSGASDASEAFRRPDPADVFKGKITMPGKAPEEDVVPFEEDLSLLRHRVDEDVFVSRDSRDFDAMDVFPEPKELYGAGEGTGGSVFDMDDAALERAIRASDEKAEVSAAVLSPDREAVGLEAGPAAATAAAGLASAELAGAATVTAGLASAESAGATKTSATGTRAADQTVTEEPTDRFDEFDTEPYVETEDYWEPVAGTGARPGVPGGSPYGAPGADGGDRGASGGKAGSQAAGAAAGEAADSGVFHTPEERKRVVTTSGKVIETDAEEVIKKKAQARKLAAAEREEADNSVKQEIKKTEEKPKKPYVIPPLDLLSRGSGPSGGQSEKEFKETAIKLQQTLRNFGVGVTVTNISCGPTVTRYELHPEQGVKVSRIQSLADDIKLNLAATDIRIEAPIPGKAAVGIEVPNKVNSVVYLRELLESNEFKKHPSRLAFAVGKDIGGQVIVADLAKMPHLLIAGQTGSGKSVGINTMIMSLIYRSSPDDVKLIMIDPKVVELSVYNGIPHLLIPVVTDPKKAAGALNWAVAEMMERYNKFASTNVRDLKGYNARVKALAESGDVPSEEIPAKLPQLVIIIDELADLMMVASNEVEDAICRLAQLARAAGIHLVIATQRPSVNVITGVIKANVPSRIAFSVASGVDSRTILDMNGAEKLLGNGDMLFYPSGYPKPVRVQGAFVSDGEVSRVTEFLKEQNEDTGYDAEVEAKMSQPVSAAGGASGGNDRDALFTDAGKFIIEKDKASIGMLQRMFKIGFNRAARIMDQLAEAGVVGEEEGTKPRKVLMSMEEFEEFLEAGC